MDGSRIPKQRAPLWVRALRAAGLCVAWLAVGAVILVLTGVWPVRFWPK